MSFCHKGFAQFWKAAAFALAMIAGFAALLAPAYPAAAGTRVDGSDLVGSVAAAYAPLGGSGNRKLVRDADGYWYAVWLGNISSQYRVYMNKSQNTDGTSWNTPVLLCGSGGLLLDTASHCYHPWIDIDRTNGRLHLVFQVGADNLYYAKLVSLANWNSASSWKNLQETASGPEVIASATGGFYITGPHADYPPSVALDSRGNPHTAWSQYVSFVYRPYYRNGSTAGGWNGTVSVSSNTLKHPTIEVDAADRVHLFGRNSTGYNIHWYYADSPYTSFSGPTTVIDSATNTLWGVSAVADADGGIHVTTQESQVTVRTYLDRVLRRLELDRNRGHGHHSEHESARGGGQVEPGRNRPCPDGAPSIRLHTMPTSGSGPVRLGAPPAVPTRTNTRRNTGLRLKKDPRRLQGTRAISISTATARAALSTSRA